MGVTKMVSLINTFSVQLCISVGKSGHKRVKKTAISKLSSFTVFATGQQSSVGDQPI